MSGDTAGAGERPLPSVADCDNELAAVAEVFADPDNYPHEVHAMARRDKAKWTMLRRFAAAVREAEAERDEAQRELAVCENALREIAVSNGVEGYAGCTCGHRERMCHRWNAAVWCGAFDAPAAANAALAAVSGEAPTDE